jgi:hypothetical protein
MYRPLRTLWTLAAVGGAIAVGLTTQNPAYIVITFVGGLIVPRMLGLAGPGRFERARRLAPGGPFAGRRGGWGGCGGDAWSEWHRQAHGSTPMTPPAAPSAPSA